jgi:hypothetical protein
MIKMELFNAVYAVHLPAEGRKKKQEPGQTISYSGTDVIYRDNIGKRMTSN